MNKVYRYMMPRAGQAVKAKKRITRKVCEIIAGTANIKSSLVAGLPVTIYSNTQS